MAKQGEVSFLDRPLFGRVSREQVVFVLLIVLAAALRFWDLGSRALHHDESLHALYSWYLFVGQGYHHDPMMHGPFQFHGTALVYFLMGVSDYTARVLPALFGTVLVGLPYFLRDRLGRAGSLLIAGMLCFSPSFLYFSRFARNDIFIAVWSLLLLIALWRYASTRRANYLYLASAVLALSFATKEVTFITVAIFASFLLPMTAKDWWQAIRSGVDFSALSPQAVFLLLLVTLVLPQGGAASALLQGFFGLTLASATPPIGAPTGTGIVVAVVVVLVLIGVSALVGLRWNGRLWLSCAAIFYSIYAMLYATFLTHPLGFGSGIWQSLGYWLAQQGVQRGGQPWFYYLLLLPLYEFLPLSLGLVGAVYFAIRGDSFRRFLAWWCLAALILYSYAGEKMPWLVLHLALPTILVAGCFLGDMAGRVSWRTFLRRGGAYLALLAPGTLLALRGAAGAGGATLALLVLLTGCLAAATFWLIWRLGWQHSLLSLAAAALVVMAAMTVRASFMATYQHGDIPVEMLVYTQTSPEIPRLMRDIEELARQMGEDEDLPITVDATSGFTWPWAWYLRDYKNVGYPGLANMSAPPTGSVLILHANNQGRAKPYLAAYGEGRRIPHRWWFPEDYRSLTPMLIWQNLLDPQTRAQAWDYFIFRKVTTTLGSEDSVAYFPKGFTPWALGLPEEAPPTEKPTPTEEPKTLSLTSNLVFGTYGETPGQLNTPRGLALDKDGNVYVSDSQNHRLQKFDANGLFVATVGAQGEGEGQFNEPWGVAVDAAGFVYVADTWNHRVQKFTPDLQFVGQWGGFADARESVEAGLGQFFGPRAVAVDNTGKVWVTDTGNKRIQCFDAEGQFIAAYGGAGSEAGRFQEPVGIASDVQGNIYVADTWNQRIQVFDASFAFVRQIDVPGWDGSGLSNKPFIAVAVDGSVLATDPENHRLFRFSAEGDLMGTGGSFGAGPSALQMPFGIAVDGSGQVYVAEAGNHRVQRFAPMQ